MIDLSLDKKKKTYSIIQNEIILYVLILFVTLIYCCF